MSPLRVEKYCQVSLQVASSQVNEWILTEILSQNAAEDLYCCTADTANAAWNLKQLQMSRPQSLSKGCLCRCWRITLWHKPPSGDCHGWVMWRDFGISAEWEAVGAWPWLPNSHTNSWLHRWEDGEMVDENWSHREGIWELLPFPWQSNASLSCWCWARQGWGCVSHPCVLTFASLFLFHHSRLNRLLLVTDLHECGIPRVNKRTHQICQVLYAVGLYYVT